MPAVEQTLMSAILSSMTCYGVLSVEFPSWGKGYAAYSSLEIDKSVEISGGLFEKGKLLRGRVVNGKA